MNKIKQTLQQQRAKHALVYVKEAKQKYQENKELEEKFVATAKDIPASIRINGLGQAMASLQAQAKSNQEDPLLSIFNALQGWLCRDKPEAPYRSTFPDLMRSIVEGDRASYLFAQAEALAYLEWYKKFAVAFTKS